MAPEPAGCLLQADDADLCCGAGMFLVPVCFVELSVACPVSAPHTLLAKPMSPDLWLEDASRCWWS